jgi:hypothetical protein
MLKYANLFLTLLPPLLTHLGFPISFHFAQAIGTGFSPSLSTLQAA